MKVWATVAFSGWAPQLGRRYWHCGYWQVMCFPSLQAKIPNNSARHAGSCCFQNCWQSSLFPCTLRGFPPAEVLCSEIQPSWWFLESVVPICCERSSINALSCLMSQPREAEHYLFGGSWWKHRVLRDLEWKHRLFIQFLWNSYFSRRKPVFVCRNP